MLCPHLGAPRAYNCFIIILGIYDHERENWLTRRSRPTSGGADTYNYLTGDADDDSVTVPARFNLTHQGDAMILRGPRYKS